MKRKSLPTGRDFLFVEGYGNENPGAFQPTRPLRGATAVPSVAAKAKHISTHAPLAGRDRKSLTLEVYYGISTHAPLAGRDGLVGELRLKAEDFNPRAPCGARPLKAATNTTTAGFQPTRPLRGATGNVCIHCSLHNDFNPRAPCGARPDDSYIIRYEMELFQPTRPLRGATQTA